MPRGGNSSRSSSGKGLFYASPPKTSTLEARPHVMHHHQQSRPGIFGGGIGSAITTGFAFGAGSAFA